MYYEYTFFYKKTIFLPEPRFSEHNARNYAEIFLTFIPLFSLIFNEQPT